MLFVTSKLKKEILLTRLLLIDILHSKFIDGRFQQPNTGQGAVRKEQMDL